MSPADPAPALLASRLSALLAHDMAGALQGLKAALALLDDSSDAVLQAEARALAQQSAAELEARLAFCRAAFAGRGLEGPAELERLCRFAFAGRRAELRWAALEPDAPGPLRQAALTFAQLAATALTAGGEATLWLHRPAGTWRARLEAVGPRLRVDGEGLAGLRRQQPTPGAPGRWAAGAFIAQSIREAGGALEVELGETSLMLEARLPGSGD
ncbi:MAG TPA: histidine phosphotransferase family protein [Caulobacteraceae bacterium]|nr:histidine phosphotransferase family protein [Caulobacteraceae bacterium]